MFPTIRTRFNRVLGVRGGAVGGGGISGGQLHVERHPYGEQHGRHGGFCFQHTYDNEGRMTGLTYPSDGAGNTGNTYAYTFGSMGRPTRLNDQTTSTDVISTATYGPAGELLTLNGPGYSESRSYNTLFQISSVGGTGTYGLSSRQTYSYSAS